MEFKRFKRTNGDKKNNGKKPDRYMDHWSATTMHCWRNEMFEKQQQRQPT